MLMLQLLIFSFYLYIFKMFKMKDKETTLWLSYLSSWFKYFNHFYSFYYFSLRKSRPLTATIGETGDSRTFPRFSSVTQTQFGLHKPNFNTTNTHLCVKSQTHLKRITENTFFTIHISIVRSQMLRPTAAHRRFQCVTIKYVLLSNKGSWSKM